MKKFTRRFKRYKTFHIEPMIYVYDNGTVCNSGITSTVRWLEEFVVEARDENEANEKAFKILKVKYPKWNVWLF